ncbi:hypothetical protein OOU_Y34scaffold00620g7 [Pyricularia oryzae Y34]|uniref:Uncharacterized protein n=2 Tax=Pyricularia oryzae TaxID=318829 RepID=A0AA97PJK8_PYRO3|nr:hypothetical protein OOU_Y34scaffold00620g7 [Pyricularia oryzae Y34]
MLQSPLAGNLSSPQGSPQGAETPVKISLVLRNTVIDPCFSSIMIPMKDQTNRTGSPSTTATSKFSKKGHLSQDV